MTLSRSPAAAGRVDPPAPEGDDRVLELVHHRRPQEDRDPLRRRPRSSFFVIGGIEALLIRLQLAGPNGTVLTASQYNAMFTMHGTTMMFLVGMPLAVAFGNYFIPLQIGARDVAFPRLNMFGYWVVPLRRPVHLLGLRARRRAERRLVRLHAAHQHAALHGLPARPRPRLLGRRPHHARHRVDHVGHQLHRHHPEHARARHDAHAHAGVRVDDARGRVPHRCSRCRSSPRR